MTSRFFDNVINFFNSEYKNESTYLSTILTEYKNKHFLYEEFRLVLHKTIESILKEDKYRYQISSRTKTLERLEEKLIRKKTQGVYYKGIEGIEDLIGIRVIFYTEKDKERFLSRLKNEISGLMKIEERKKENGYHATHVIISFGSKRLKLSEYKHFKDLKSELQITSILHHAWAEIEHDLIYKDIKGLKNRNPKKFESVKEKIYQLLEKYIKKAATELEEIIEEDTKNL